MEGRVRSRSPSPVRRATQEGSDDSRSATPRSRSVTPVVRSRSVTPTTLRSSTKDTLHTYEVSFLWPIISLLSLIIFPYITYYCYICLQFNHGQLLLPQGYDLESIYSFFAGINIILYNNAIPTWRSTTVYTLFLLLEAILFLFAPGPTGQGEVLPNGKRLTYKFNGQFSFFFTVLVAFLVHYFDVFHLTELYYNYAQYQTLANITTFTVILLLFIWGKTSNQEDRKTNSLLYDYFMGVILNPRFTIFGEEFDVKFFFELRVGIIQWFLIDCALLLKMYSDYGFVSSPLLLVCFYHLCFINACFKGEQCVIHTMDIVYEKFGWMLCFLDLSTVPFIFTLQTFYLTINPPFELPLFYTLGLLGCHLFGYWMFDTSNSQKDYFRMVESKTVGIKRGFPKLPWDRIEKPEYLETRRGKKILVDGWWKYGRHLNYTGDLMMSWSWAITSGWSASFGWSIFPFAYPFYLTSLLIHREYRDNLNCREKYGEDWEKYSKRVPYRLIPYVY